MIQEWLNSYRPTNKAEASAALQEIMQEITLAGLYRGGFFEKAAFYGGTCLRVFHGLDRFSEDLDFSLLTQNPGFSLDSALESVKSEFSALGMKVSIKEKIKSKDTHIDSAFLKPETIWKELILDGSIPQVGLQETPSIKIKIEVDTNPPLGFETEERLLLRPFSFYTKCFALPDLFAGKMHAVLFRKWKENVKGRDWYDFEWYIKKGTPLHLAHFTRRAKESGDLAKKNLTKEGFKELLLARIEDVNLNRAKADVARFIPDSSKLDIWSKDYFKDLVAYLKFV